MRQPFLTILAVTLLGCIAAQATPITVVNGSFEFPDSKTTWNSLPDPNGSLFQYSEWTYTTSSPYQIYYTPDTEHFNNNAPDGKYVLNTGAAGTISQDLNTVVGLGNAVTLSFDIGQTRTGYGKSTLTAEIFSGSTLIGSGVFASNAAAGQWDSVSLTAVVTVPGDISISFVSSNDPPWLDNITVSYDAIVVTPEPRTMSLLAMGFVAALLVACRMRAKSVA